jgi:hypothetical protein
MQPMPCIHSLNNNPRRDAELQPAVKFEPCSHIKSLDAEYFTLRLRVMELQQEINELVKKGMADGPEYHAKVTM